MTRGRPRPSSRSIRVATFNIRHAAAPGHGVDHQRIIAAIGALGADVVALQEVDRRHPRSRLADQARLVGSALGCHGVFLRSRFHWGGAVGNGLVCATAPRSIRMVPLPRGHRQDRRMAVIASLDTALGPLTVVSTHLHPAPDQNVRQLRVLLDLTAGLSGPAVLLGDLNAGSARVGDLVAAAGWERVAHGPTFPAHAPTDDIDWIALRGLRSTSVEVGAGLDSDHLPVVAEVVAT